MLAAVRLRLSGVVMAALACVVLAGTAFATPATGGRHFPHFSLLGERIAVKKLPPEVRLMVAPGGVKDFAFPRLHPGPVWFGQVARPGTTLAAVAQGHWICQYELPNGEVGGGGGGCTTTGYASRSGMFQIRYCARGRPRHFRISGLLPDGVTALTVEREDGTVGRTVPVSDNTAAFTIGRENIVLRGVGNATAESIERNYPLAAASKDSGGSAGCGGFVFAESRSTG